MKLLITLIAVVMMNSCNRQQGNQPMAHENDILTVEEVENRIEDFRQALLTPDQSALEGLTFESMTYGHSLGLIEDRETFVHSLVSGKFLFTHLEFSNQTIYTEGDIAIVRHTLFGHTADEGKEPGTVTLKVLTVWQKTEGKLRLLARQAVRL